MKSGLFFIFFLFACSAQGQIAINELFPDPNPSVDLPEEEFIELFNFSPNPVELENWSIADASSQAFLPAFTLQPNQFVILCDDSSSADFQPFGDVLGINLPSLNNSSDEISLRNTSNELVDFVAYTNTWYQDVLKDDGGWTLERINPSNVCDGMQNWRASVNLSGGSPGSENSIYDESFVDDSPLEVESVWLVDESNLEITLSKKPDENQALEPSLYSITPSVTIQAISLSQDEKTIRVEFQNPVLSETVYSISVNNLQDCAALSSLSFQEQFGLPATAQSGDIILNEILFNPVSDQVDFVELVNVSDQLFAIDDLTITELNPNNDDVEDFVDIQDTRRYFFSGEILVLTQNPDLVQEQYPVAESDQMLEISLPNFPNEIGKIQVLNEQLTVLDQLTYNEGWHFEFLNRFDGVSLERLDKQATTQDQNNWFSASADVNFASPTKENSQKPLDELSGDELLLSNNVFTPDLDGNNDFLTISLSTQSQGITATISVFNVRGYRVNTIINNQLVGANNEFRWTGLDENNEPLPLGHYIIVAEYFDADGNQKVLKEKVVLSRRR